jgi:hypothetical protein
MFRMRNKLARNRVRSRGRLVMNSYNRMVAQYAYLQDQSDWKLWTFRTISERSALILVANGEAEPVTREVVRTTADGQITKSVEVVGYRALKPTSWERPSPATLTFGTMQSVAGLRAGRRAADEVIKFRVWPLIGDTRAVAVRPRMSEADLQEAGKLMKLTESERIFFDKRLVQTQRAHAQRVA